MGRAACFRAEGCFHHKILKRVWNKATKQSDKKKTTAAAAENGSAAPHAVVRGFGFPFQLPPGTRR